MAADVVTAAPPAHLVAGGRRADRPPGVSRTVTAPLTVVRSAGDVRVSGQVPILFADYSIDNPSIGGFVTTEDGGIIEILLVLRKGD